MQLIREQVRWRLSSSVRPSFVRGFLILFFAFILSTSVAAPVHAEFVTTKKDTLRKYEQAVELVEKLNVYQEDIFRILPKVRLAGNALLNDDIYEASSILDDVLGDLEVISSQSPVAAKSEFRLEWLEIYADIFQKIALLALFAFLFARWPYFRRMLQADNFTNMGKVYLVLVLGTAAVFFSLFDLSRYGESAWAFFDLQVVLIAIGGLLGGFIPGTALGLIVGVFRWIVKPEFLVYFAIAVVVGIIAGALSRKVSSFKEAGRMALLTGFIVGLLHGMFIYIPVLKALPWFFVVFSILLLSILEGGGVMFFFAVVAGILKEEKRRDMEQELLKTKLLFLQTQMSPHFLFNALNAISAICRRENAFQAQKLILSLSDFLRRTLKRADEKVSLREEWQYIQSYLDIEKARFQDRLKVEESCAVSDETWKSKVPILILQPLVENAIKHGISKKETGGTLKIQMSDSGQMLEVCISDDGVGMTKEFIEDVLAGKVSSEQVGIGVKNIHERLRRIYGKNCLLKYETESHKGTKVTIRMPIEKEKAEVTAI